MPGAVFAEGERVQLRTVEEEDLDFVQRWRNHPDVRRPLTDSAPRNGEQIREYFENRVSDDGDGFGFLVCVDERSESTGEASGEAASSADDEAAAESENADESDSSDDDDVVPVGAVHIPWVRQPHGTGMLMYWVAPPHQGNGYVTEATELILDHAFEERRLAKVSAIVLETNGGSQRVLEKLGFEREGVHRKETFVDGERRDNYRYGLLAEEWLDDSGN